MSGPTKRGDAYQNIFARPLPTPSPSDYPPGERNSPQPPRRVSGRSLYGGEVIPSNAPQPQRYYSESPVNQGYNSYQNQSYGQELTYGGQGEGGEGHGQYQDQYSTWQQGNGRAPSVYQNSSNSSERSPALSNRSFPSMNNSYASTIASGPSSASTSSQYPYSSPSALPYSHFDNPPSMDSSPSLSPLTPDLSLPPHLPRTAAYEQSDDFYGFESSRRDSGAESLGNGERQSPQYYIPGEEVDGFDQYGASVRYRE